MTNDQEKKKKALKDAAEMSARIRVVPDTDTERRDPYYASDPTPVKNPFQGIELRHILLLLFCMALFGAGCWTGAKVARKHDNSVVVATVNGEPILANDFLHRCEIVSGASVLPQMITGKLQLQFARQKGVLPTPAAVESRYLEYTRQKDFLARLRAANETEEVFKQDLQVKMAQDAVLNKGINITDAEVEQCYKENSDPHNPHARFYHPATVTIAVIITRQEADIRKAQKELASGAPFPEVVARYSKDVSKTNGGVLAPIRHGQVDPNKLMGLETRLFDIPVGKYTEPTKINGNWWIIRCLQKSPELIDSFDKVADDCRAGVLRIKGYKANGNILKEEEASFGHNAEVTFNWPQYAGTVRRR